jgi:EAL domain-containing protein (putative c-di-GMP-specific phosphodiesterase class I)
MLNLPQNMPMVSAIIQIGHNLKLKVIADGVETDVQESLLKKNKCDGYQRNASISEPEVRRLFGRRWF